MSSKISSPLKVGEVIISLYVRRMGSQLLVGSGSDVTPHFIKLWRSGLLEREEPDP